MLAAGRGDDRAWPRPPSPPERGLHDEARWKTPVSSLAGEVTCVFLSIRLCLLTGSPLPPASLHAARSWFSGSPGGSVSTSPRTCHPCMSAFCQCASHAPKFAENRKPRQLEGSPVIHQGMTAQLFGPVLGGGVSVRGGFLPSLPFPGWPGGAERAWTLSYHLWRWHGQTLLGPSFCLSSLAFFGVGRLKNVECCNVGKGGGETGASSPAQLILLTPVLGELQAPLGPLVPFPSPSQEPPSPCAFCAWTCGPGHTSCLGYSCGFQLFEAAVVASSKSGCGSATDEARGAIYSRVALGPGAGPAAWGGSATPRQDQQNGDG